MQKLAFLLVFSSSLALGANNAGSCPENWVDATLTGMGCLLFNTSKAVTWDDASISCFHSNSFLVEIETELQMSFLSNQLTMLANNGITAHWWTSATDLGREGLWYWTSSLSPVPDFVWNSDVTGQPDGGPHQNCGNLRLYFFLWEFFDDECDSDNYNDEPYYPVCQIK